MNCCNGNCNQGRKCPGDGAIFMRAFLVIAGIFILVILGLVGVAYAFA